MNSTRHVPILSTILGIPWVKASTSFTILGITWGSVSIFFTILGITWGSVPHNSLYWE